VQREAHEVGRHDDPVARQPVGEHAADEQEGHERQAVGGEHGTEIRGAAGEIDDEERERDDDDRVADAARSLPEPQQAKVAVAQDAQEPAQTAHRWGRQRPGSIRTAAALRRRSPGYRAQGTSTESSCGASRATTYSAASDADGFSSRCVSRGGT
jgi:hypothetical protein